VTEEWSRPLEPELMFWILGVGPSQSEFITIGI